MSFPLCCILQLNTFDMHPYKSGRKVKLKNASAYVFHFTRQELLNVSLAVSTKRAQRLRSQTEEE